MKKLLPLALVAVMAAPFAASAQNAAAQVQPLTREHFDELDKDKSGTVSRAEYQSFMENSFILLDVDGDGKLTLVEASRVLTPEQFSSVDANRDGTISRDEFMTQVMKDFDRYDYNKDGQLQHP